LDPQPSLGLGLLHKIRLNFLEASKQISFLQGRVVSPTPNPHPGGPGLCIYIPQRQGGTTPGTQWIGGYNTLLMKENNFSGTSNGQGRSTLPQQENVTADSASHLLQWQRQRLKLCAVIIVLK
jgi:hypothetical protein